jgi:hypothetical protein
MLTRLCNAVAVPLVRYQMILQSVSIDFAVCRTISRLGSDTLLPNEPTKYHEVKRLHFWGVCSAEQIRNLGGCVSLNEL